MVVCMGYRRGNHKKFKIVYHFVWVTKYRYHMLLGDLALRVRELVRQTCEYFEIQILHGVISKDHVHILCVCTSQYLSLLYYAKNKG
jgi:REP-associated tyrosine transposase